MLKKPLVVLMSVVIAVILVAGTAATLNLSVVKHHNLEQSK